MAEIHCFVSKEGSDYDKAVRKQWKQSYEWDKVITAMAVHMKENFTQMYTITVVVGFPPSVISTFSEDHRKMFKKNGFLKVSGKSCKQLLAFYKSLLNKFGLEDYKAINDLRFSFGMYRLHGQTSEGYRDFDGHVYSRCDFIPSGADKYLTPISELEYTETYARLLKEQEKRKKGA